MPTIERLLLTYAANAAWMTCLVAAAAALLSKWIRQGPCANRHILWVVALALASVLPLTTLRSSTNGTLAVSSGHRQETSLSPSNTRPGFSLLHSLWSVTQGGGLSISSASFSADFLSTLYLAFLCYRGTRLWWGWRGTKQILRGCSGVIPSSAAVVVRDCCTAFAVPHVTVLTSREVTGPVALGIRHPVLVFPEWFLVQATEEELASSVCHELAHVRRKDFLLNLLYELVSLPASFHPAMAFIKSRVDGSRELACDELAAEKISPRGIYVRSLVSIAQGVARGVKLSGLALGLFDANFIEERVVNLLEERDYRHKRALRLQTVVALSVLVGICLITSPFSIRVAATGSEGKLKSFAGKWVAKFEGRTFLTVELNTESNKVTGTITRTDFHINPAGELSYARPLSASDATSEARLTDGGALVLATGTNGSLHAAVGTGGVTVPVRYKMRLVGRNEADFQIDGIPSGMPIPKPWRLERGTVNP